MVARHANFMSLQRVAGNTILHSCNDLFNTRYRECNSKLHITTALDGNRLLIDSKVCRVTFEYALSVKVPSTVSFL